MTMKAGGAMAMLAAMVTMTACRAEIRGTVVVRGDAIPGATVTILSSGLPEARRAVTDRFGRYSFTSLKPGRYTVETSLTGLDGPNHELILTPGSVAILELLMFQRPQRAVGAVDANGGTGVVADEVGIRGLVTRYEDASEKGDPKLLEILFAEDADQLTATGEWFRGRENIVRHGAASPPADPGSRHIAIERMQFVAPGVAVVNGRYEITEAPAAPPRRMRTTLVIVRVASGEWRIEAIRNMAPTDPTR